MDTSKLTLTEAKKLLEELKAAIPALEKQEKAKALEEMQKLAKDRGFDLADLVGVKAPNGKTGIKVAAKYANPADPSQTWTGRGRSPEWAKGRDKRELEIRQH